MILVKTVRAKKDTTIVTRIEEVHMYAGQVMEVKFLSQAEYEGHVAGGFIEEYKGEIPADQKPPEIPIINPTPTVVTVHTPTADKAVSVVENVTGVAPKENVTQVPVDTATAPVDHTPPAEPIVENINQEPVIPDPVPPVDVVISKEAQVEELNKKGPPYKCSTPFCDRIRRKTELYCKVCLDSQGK